MIEVNRYPITGVVTEITETRQFSPYFKKRECKIRISDTDFTGKIVERKIKFGFINEFCEMLDMVRIDDTVQMQFYIDGRDVVKDNQLYNFTNLIAYDVIVLNSPERATDEDRNALITKDGLVFEEPQEKEVSIADVMNASYEKFMIEPDDMPIEKEEKKDSDNKQVFEDLPF